MLITRARLSLIGLFLAGLVSQIIGVLLVFSEHSLRHQDLVSLLSKLLAIYSVQFAVMLGGIFAEDEGVVVARAQSAFWVAFVTSLLWNCIFVVRTALFVFAQNDSSQALASYFDTVSASSSFLVSGALAYFFTKKMNAVSKKST